MGLRSAGHFLSNFRGPGLEKFLVLSGVGWSLLLAGDGYGWGWMKEENGNDSSRALSLCQAAKIACWSCMACFMSCLSWS